MYIKIYKKYFKKNERERERERERQRQRDRDRDRDRQTDRQRHRQTDRQRGIWTFYASFFSERTATSNYKETKGDRELKQLTVVTEPKTKTKSQAWSIHH